MSHRSRLKAAIRRAIARALYVVGALHVIMRIRTRNRAVVLMYHRVLGRDSMAATYSHPGIIVQPSTFEDQLRFLRRHFHVATLAEFADAAVSGRSFAKPTCLVTFDDGWEDNFTQAFPLLRRHRLPAVVFLTTGFVGTGRRFWQESLAHALFAALKRNGNGGGEAIRGVLARLGIDAGALTADESGRSILRDSVSRAKSFPEAERQALLETALQAAGAPGLSDHADRFLDWDQVRAMAAAGIDFGSHTVDHELLPDIPSERARYQIERSKRAIEEALRTMPYAFSYPSGKYDAESRRIVGAGGFTLAFGTEPGLFAPGDDPLSIRRINVHEGAAPTLPLFMARIAGVM